MTISVTVKVKDGEQYDAKVIILDKNTKLELGRKRVWPGESQEFKLFDFQSIHIEEVPIPKAKT